MRGDSTLVLQRDRSKGNVRAASKTDKALYLIDRNDRMGPKIIGSRPSHTSIPLSVFYLPLRRARRDWATRLRDAASSEGENGDFDQCSDSLTASKWMGRTTSAGPQDSHEQGTIKRLGHLIGTPTTPGFDGDQLTRTRLSRVVHEPREASRSQGSAFAFWISSGPGEKKK